MGASLRQILSVRGQSTALVRVLSTACFAGSLLTSTFAMAADDQLPSPDASIRPTGRPAYSDEIRSAQLQWLFGPPAPRVQPAPAPSRAPQLRGQDDARYYYVQSRDIFGNPGRVYRVLGVEHPKRKKLAGGDRTKQRAADLLRRSPAPPPTSGPLLLAISLSKQQVTIYDQGAPIATSPISSGTPSHPTPTGVFSVIQKQWWHRSNLYSDAPMPFMQRLTWSGVALHAGNLPGYPASHGCIRLPDEFAVRLWGTTQVGVRVVVTRNEVRPVEIAHPRLFAPKPKAKPPENEAPVASNDPRARPPIDPESIASSVARQGQIAVGTVPVTPFTLDRAAANEGMALLATLNSGARLIPPDGAPPFALEADENERTAERDPEENSGGRTITVVRGGRPTQVLELADPPDVTEEGLARITVVHGGRVADIDVLAVETMTPEPQLALVMPELPVAVANAGGYAAVRNGRRRVQDAQPATPPAPQARPLRPGPVSVFVSRRERRLYVRKGFEPLFDAPVTISSPDKALGTHVFTALAVNESDARWNVVTLPTETTIERRVVDESRSKRRSRRYRTVTEVVSVQPASPREALDRIEMPAEAVTRISELLAAGASLIISDEGLGRETGRETDFVVLTK
jgi:hypothetical protein